MSGIKYLDAQTFRDDGYLQEANRGFFHPLGLALELSSDGTLRVWDCRDDAEGIRFSDADLAEKATRLREISDARREARIAALGYWQQPESGG
jgi:hypothetical protein